MVRVLLASSHKDQISRLRRLLQDKKITVASTVQDVMHGISKKYDLAILSDKSHSFLEDFSSNHIPVLVISDNFRPEYSELISWLPCDFSDEDLTNRVKYLLASNEPNKALVEALRDVKKSYDDFSAGIFNACIAIKR